MVVIVATAVGFALRCYQLIRPGYLLGVTGYDDGVDFGSAVRLVHGLLPYRDFAFVQPPGITLLMAPVAALGSAIGSDAGLAVARILTMCAGAASVALTGMLIRHRGALATTLACGIVAVNPDAILAAHSVLLEPWLVLFCLAGSLIVFDHDRLSTSPARLALGGIAFGFGGAIKVWAIFPVLVVVALCRPWRGPRLVAAYLGGVSAGFWIPVIPFVVNAPRAFVGDVIVAQLSRADAARQSVPARLLSLTGIRDLTPGTTAVLAVSLAITASIVICAVRAPRPRAALNSFALATTTLVAIAFLAPADYYPHYAGFFAPFLALAIALPAAWLAADRRAVVAVATAALAALTVVQFRRETRLAATYPATTVQRMIPAGACVLTDVSSYAIVADRFTSTDPHCSPIVDAIGTDYALARGRNALVGAGRSDAVQAAWLSAFDHAQFVWLNCAPIGAAACNQSTNRRIPRTPAISGYFAAHFRPVPGPVPYLYARRR